MAGSQLILVLTSAAFFLSAAGVGIRLLMLARRTRGLPERLMGVGLTCVITLYIPIMAYSGIGRLAVSEVKVGVLAFGSIFIWLGVTCLVAFTWKVFRPDEDWALALTVLLGSGVAAACGGMVASLLSSPGEARSFEVAQLWTGLLRVPMLISFGWTGLEGLHQYRLARRRYALGLGDPVVANRFLLWGVVGLVQVVITSVSVVLHFRGAGMMGSPVALFIMAVGGLVGAVFLILTFLPPKAYVSFVRRRAAAEGT